MHKDTHVDINSYSAASSFDGLLLATSRIANIT
jgi:hypothetical protein